MGPSGTASAAAESDLTTYDVMVKLPARKKISAISPLSLQAAGIPEKHIQHLLDLLARGQMAKVKGSVPEARAREIGQRFLRAGLEVGITPAITVYTIVGDGKETCPACGYRVALPDNRQCPQCNVFVDKVSRRFLAKRRKAEHARALREAKQTNAKLDKAEQNRIAALEEEFHTRILRELGPRYRLVRRFRPLHGKSQWLRFGLGAFAVGALFAAGFGSAMLLSAAIKPPPDSDAAPESAVVTALRQRLLSAGLIDVPVDPRSEPISVALPATALLRGPQGERLSFRRLGLEHAVEALFATPAAGAPPSVTLSMSSKLRMGAQLAQTLTELGQTARAQDLIKALKDAPELALEPAAAALVRRVEIETLATALLVQPEPRARSGYSKLLPQIATLSDTPAKVHTMCRVAVIMSQHRDLPVELARDVLTQAGSIARTITAPAARSAALGDVAVAKGELLHREIDSLAQRGLQSTATAPLAQLAGLVKDAPDGWSRARLQAVQGKTLIVLGERDAGNAAIDAAIAGAARIEDSAEQAASLRGLLRYLPPAAEPRLKAAAALLHPKIEALTGRDKAQAALQLSLLYAELGGSAAADQWAQAARSTAGISADERNSLAAEGLLQRDLAGARLAQSAQQYADVAAALRRVAGYLL